jgi:hypothetical protein
VSTGIEGLARDGATGQDTPVGTVEQPPQRVAVVADAAAEGFTTLALMATLPGEPLYRADGFRGPTA